MVAVHSGDKMIARVMNLWHRWGLKVGFSIADQGTVSGANFVLNLLLARWFTPAEYGAFAIAFSAFLFLSGFHNALILEPMSVIGPSRYKGQLAKYVGATVWIHGGLTLGLAGILAFATAIMAIKGSSLSSSFLGLTIAMFFILLFWLLRRACYLETRPYLALKGSFFYALFLLLGLFITQRQSWLSPFSAFLLMALASIGASLVLWRSLGVRVSKVSWTGDTPGIGVVLAEHWGYGRWIVGSALVYWLSSTIYLPLVGGFVGLVQAGGLRAMQNLVLPLQQILTALGLLLLPWVSRQRTIQGKGYPKGTLSKITMVNVSLAGGYVLFLGLFGQRVLELLYGQGHYTSFLWLLPFLAGATLIATVGRSLGIILRAMERPDAIFWSKLGAAISVLSVGILLVWQWELNGAMFSLVLSTSLETAVVLYYTKWNRLRK